MSINLLEKNYDGESIVDLARDVDECFNGDYNPEASLIPVDEHGFHKGTFRVTIEWIGDEE